MGFGCTLIQDEFESFIGYSGWVDECHAVARGGERCEGGNGGQWWLRLVVEWPELSGGVIVPCSSLLLCMR